jgi:predicted MFS family arabinose efflux permease
MVGLAREVIGSRPAKWFVRLLGGPARARVVVALSGVLALNTADGAVLGAIAGQLEHAFGIGHARFGAIVAVAAATGAVAAPFAGVLADRTNRIRILTFAIVVWALAMTAAGLSTGYWWLFSSRLALGAALAATGPVVASLVGDLFHPSERSRAYGLILTGELVGAAVGLAAGGLLGSLVSWRSAFFALAAASLLFAFVLPRALKEPERGGGSWITEADPSGCRPGADGNDNELRAGELFAGEGIRPADNELRAGELFAGEGIRPASSRVLHAPPEQLSLLPTVRYLLSIPSFRRLVLASAMGYFFFAGLRTFAVLFAIRYYGLTGIALGVSLVVIGAAAVVGTVSGGRLADTLLRRGTHIARLVVAATGYLVAVVGFAPGLLATAVPVAIGFLALGTVGLAGANPPLDAARLDIVPGRLWGRGESVRTLTRLGAEAIAPILFGVSADYLGGDGHSGSGLRNAFLIMLVPLAINGVLVAACRRTYPTDTVTATASDRRDTRLDVD